MLSLASKSERERFLMMVMAMIAVKVWPGSRWRHAEARKKLGAMLEPGNGSHRPGCGWCSCEGRKVKDSRKACVGGTARDELKRGGEELREPDSFTACRRTQDWQAFDKAL